MDKIALEILDRVDSFYSSAFSQLITITLGIIAFAGIFVPILTTYYQNRNIKIEKQNLEDYINNRIESLKSDLSSEIRKELLEELKAFEGNQESKTARAVAGVLHVQANHQLSRSQFKNATNSILSAIESCIQANDELNLSRGLKILIEKCLPNINKKEEPNLDALEKRIEDIARKISDLNENGRYVDSLEDLKTAYKKAATRLAESEQSEA